MKKSRARSARPWSCPSWDWRPSRAGDPPAIAYQESFRSPSPALPGRTLDGGLVQLDRDVGLRVEEADIPHQACQQLAVRW